MTEHAQTSVSPRTTLSVWHALKLLELLVRRDGKCCGYAGGTASRASVCVCVRVCIPTARRATSTRSGERMLACRFVARRSMLCDEERRCVLTCAPCSCVCTLGGRDDRSRLSAWADTAKDALCACGGPLAMLAALRATQHRAASKSSSAASAPALQLVVCMLLCRLAVSGSELDREPPGTNDYVHTYT